MKKILFYFAVILAASTFSMSSCSSNNDDEAKTSESSVVVGYWVSETDSTRTLELSATGTDEGIAIYTMMDNGRIVTKKGKYVYYPTKKTGYITASDGSDLYFNFKVSNPYKDYYYILYSFRDFGDSMAKSTKK